MTTEASWDEEPIVRESERSGALFASVLSSAAGKQKTFTRGMIIHAVSKGLASPTYCSWSRLRVELPPC
jgi:hypothetical protein